MTKVEATSSLLHLENRLQGIDKGLVKFDEITSTQGKILFASKLDPQNLNGNPVGTLVEIGKRRKRVVTAIKETLRDKLLAQREITTQGIMKIPVKLGLSLPKGIEIEQSEEPRDEVLTSTPEIQVVDDISGTTNEEFIEGPSTPQEDEEPPEKDVVRFTKKESVLYELLEGNMGKGLSPDEISEQFKERFPDMDLAEIRYGLLPKILKSLREKLRIDGEDIENTAHQGKNASYILVRSTNLESFHEVNVGPIEQDEEPERPRNNSQEEDPLHINYRKLLGAKMPGINALQLSEITTRLVLELSDRHLVHEDKLVKIFGSTRPEIVKQAIDLARQELANSGLEIIELSNQTGVAFLLQGELNTGRANSSEGIGSTLQKGQLQTVNPESRRKRTEIEEIQLLFAGVIITQLSSSATFNGTRFTTLEINPTAFARGHGKEVLEKIRTSMINPKHEDPRSITDDMLKREIVEWISNGLKMYWDELQLDTVSKDIFHNRILNTLKNFVQEQKTKGRTITLKDLTKIISDYFARKEPDGTPSPPGRKYRQPYHGKMKL